MKAAGDSTEQREVLRCDNCGLVQFRPVRDLCRRCHKSIDIQEEAPTPAPPVLATAQSTENESLPIAIAVRDIRRVRKLSQRQLAALIDVQRTYISKIESGKVMLTPTFLIRLAKALKVNTNILIRGAGIQLQEGPAALLDDPFIAEVAAYSSKLDSRQRNTLLHRVRLLAHRNS